MAPLDELPQLERLLEGPGSEHRLATLKARFERALVNAEGGPIARLFGGLRARRESAAPARRALRNVVAWTTPVVVGAGGAFLGLAFWDAADTFGSPGLATRHLASAAHCSVARAVDLAPARRGEPGYWPMHDGDQDGVACERTR